MRLLHQEVSTHFYSNREPTLTIIYFLCALVDILPILLIYCWSVKNSRNTVLLLKEKTRVLIDFAPIWAFIQPPRYFLFLMQCAHCVLIRHHSGTQLLFITASNNWLLVLLKMCKQLFHFCFTSLVTFSVDESTNCFVYFPSFFSLTHMWHTKFSLFAQFGKFISQWGQISSEVAF